MKKQKTKAAEPAIDENIAGKIVPVDEATQVGAETYQEIIPPPFLSICIIHKDEPHYLFGLLRHALEIADEVIVCDTGSNDAELLEDQVMVKYQVDFHHIPFENFAQARNECKKFANGHWIMFLDCDETLRAVNSENDVKNLLYSSLQSLPPEIQGVKIMNENHLQDSQERAYRAGLRVFRNNPAYHFVGYAYDEIEPSIIENTDNDDETIIGLNGLKIVHMGFFTAEERAAKSQRNLALIIKECEKDPTSASLYRKASMILAKQSNPDGRPKEDMDYRPIIEAAKDAEALCEEKTILQLQIFNLLAYVYTLIWEAKRDDDARAGAINYCKQSILLNNEQVLPLFLYATILISGPVAEYRKAQEFLQGALHYRRTKNPREETRFISEQSIMFVLQNVNKAIQEENKLFKN